MNKKLKIGLVIGMILLVLLAGLIFWINSLPKAKTVEPTTTHYIQKQNSSEQKVEVDASVKKTADQYISTFFTFDGARINKLPNSMTTSDDYRKYFDKYGKGEAIAYKLINASQNSTQQNLLTYDIWGLYKGQKKHFSIIVTLEHSSEEKQIQLVGTTVVQDE